MLSFVNDKLCNILAWLIYKRIKIVLSVKNIYMKESNFLIL